MSEQYFGRYYKLTLGSGSEQMVFETEAGRPAMDIKFDVTFARGVTAREGTISILGLSRDTILKYLMLSGETRGKAMSQLMEVKLEVGYFSEAGTVEILNGFAWYGTVTAPPEMWLTLKISEYNPMGGKSLELTEKDALMPIKEAVEDILAQFSKAESGGGKDITFKLEDKTHDGIDPDARVKYSILGKKTLGDVIRDLNQQTEGIKFILRTRNQQEGVRTLLAVDADSTKFTQAANFPLIDGDHGLLSVSGIDAVNGCITTFIDGRVADELTKIKLESWLNPQANGEYIIVKKQYVGHFLGQEWYSRYFCSDRVGANRNNGNSSETGQEAPQMSDYDRANTY